LSFIDKNSKEKTPRFIAFVLALSILIAGIVFVFYVNNLTAVLDHDSISYSQCIEKNSWGEIYHAHHLLYNYFKWVVYDLLKTNGYEGRALIVNQTFNAFFGAVGVGILFFTIWYITGSLFLSFVSGIFMMISNGYWYCSTFGGVRVMGTAFLLFTFLLAIIFIYQKSLKHWQNILLVLGIAAANSIAVFCHQTNIMFAAVILVLMVFKKETFLKKTSYLLLYILFFLTIVIGLYWYVGWKVFYCTTWDRYLAWLAGYVNLGIWGEFTDQSLSLSKEGVRALYIGFVEGRVEFYGYKINNYEALNIFVNSIKVILLFFAVFSFLIFKKWKEILAAAAVWLLLYLPFFIWWEPGNLEFWLPLLPLSIILFSLPLGIIWNIAGNKIFKYILRSCLAVLSAAVVLVFANYNYYNLILPKTDPGKNFDKMAMEQLSAVREGPEDLVIIMGWDALRVNLNYYFSQDFISIYWLSTKYKTNSDGFYACISKRISDKIKEKHKVFLHKDVLRAKDFKDINAGYKALEKDSFISFFKDKFELTPVKEGKDNYFYEAKLKTAR